MNQIQMWQTQFLTVDRSQNELGREAIIQFLRSGHSVFLTGGAGSGKTHMLKQIVSQFQQTAILAPTGIAASNVGGQTIHSFFSLPPHLQKPSEVNAKIKNAFLVKRLQLLVIDEISMVNPLLLDCIDNLMQRIRGCGLPFGGCAILFCGDIAQLPPVIQDKKTGDGLSQKEVLVKMGYSSTLVTDSKVWASVKYVVELQGSWRQDGDPHFFNLLSDIRNHLLDKKKDSLRSTFSEINSQCVGRNLPPKFTTLASTNNRVREINGIELDKMQGEECCYDATVVGEWRDEFSRAPRQLILKEGVQVICVANDPLKQFMNGSIAEVVELEPKAVWVKLEDKQVIKVQPQRWDNWQYKWDEESGRMSVQSVGHFIQLPFQVGYALTIHSSQGLTLKRVNFMTERLFDQRLAYVALSRCPSLQSLSLSQSLH